jgi:hypothetical protein
MLKRQIWHFYLILCCITLVYSCALLRQTLDKMSGISRYLKQTEAHIRNEEWQNAAASLRKSIKAWYRIKPYFQIDINHNYVKDIENDFIRLRGTIQTRQKPDSTVLILVLEDNWREIGSM